MVQYLNTKEEFNEQIQEGICIVDFTATWCGPCQRVGPEFENLASQMHNIKFFKVDVDKNDQVTQQQNITCMPTFQIFQNGRLVDTVTGADINKVKVALEKLS